MYDLDKQESMDQGMGGTGYACSPVVTSLGPGARIGNVDLLHLYIPCKKGPLSAACRGRQ